MKKHKSNEAVREQSLRGVATTQPGDGKIGHNKGGTVKLLTAEYEAFDEKKREISQAQREIKAKLKEQGVNIMAFNQILRERKMEDDVRAHFMEDCHIVRDALGMQISLFDKAAYEGAGQRGMTEDEIEASRAPNVVADPIAAAAKAAGEAGRKKAALN